MIHLGTTRFVLAATSACFLLVAASVGPVIAQTGACCTATSPTSFSCVDNVASTTCTNEPTESWIFGGTCPSACTNDLAACCSALGCTVANGLICSVIQNGVSLPGNTCLGDPCATLPVELSYVTATASDGGITVSWQTETEESNFGFEVQWTSNDAFETHGFVEGHGTTDIPQQYEYRIDDAGAGLWQVRLKQIDFDGAFSYSPAVEVAVELPEQYYIETPYPNPFNPAATIRFGSAGSDVVSLALYDAAGRQVRELFSGAVEAGQMQEVSLKAGDLPSGTYVLRMEGRATATQLVSIAK